MVCDSCGLSYELDENDVVRDFVRECQCGGRLRYKAKNPETVKTKDDEEEKIQIDMEDLIHSLNSGSRNEKIKAAKQLAVIGDERALKPLYKVWFKNDIYAAKYAIEKIKEREKIDLDKKEQLNLKKEYGKIQKKQSRSWTKISGARIPKKTSHDPGTNKWLSNFKRNFKEDLLGNLLGLFLVVVAIFITAIILAFC